MTKDYKKLYEDCIEYIAETRQFTTFLDWLGDEKTEHKEPYNHRIAQKGCSKNG